MNYNWNNNIDKSYGFNMNRIHPKENIFHSIYILDNVSGALYVSNKYSDKMGFPETSEDLISSFLNAMSLFISELNQDEEIQEVNFRQMRILYEKKGKLTVIAISKKTNLEVEKYFVHEILDDFYQRFENQINHFNGIIDPAILNYKNRLKTLDLSKSWAYNNFK